MEYTYQRKLINRHGSKFPFHVPNAYSIDFSEKPSDNETIVTIISGENGNNGLPKNLKFSCKTLSKEEREYLKYFIREKTEHNFLEVSNKTLNFSFKQDI